MNGSLPNTKERSINIHAGSHCPSDGGTICLGLDLHGWLRLLTYWAMCFLRPIGYSAIGIFVVEFREYFQDASQQQIAWIAACQLGIVALFCSVPIGWLTERFGSRRIVGVSALVGSSGLVLSYAVNSLVSLYIGYGIMLGWCLISYQIIASILIQTTLKVRRNLLAGVSYTIMSAGAFVWPAVSRLLIDAISWQGALLVLAGVNLNVIALSQLLPNSSTSRKSEMKITKSETSTSSVFLGNNAWDAREYTICDQTGKQISQESIQTNNHKRGYFNICGRPSYQLLSILCVAHFFNQITLFSTFMYFPVRCQDEGFTKKEAVLIVSLMSISSCLFRTPAGALGDIRRINVCFVSSAANLVTGAACVVSTLCPSLTGLAICGCVIGASFAFAVGLLNATTEYLGGTARLPMAFAFLNTAQGLCMTTSLPLSGLFLDQLGDSRTLFLCLGGAGILGGIFVGLAGILRRNNCTKAPQ